MSSRLMNWGSVLFKRVSTQHFWKFKCSLQFMVSFQRNGLFTWFLRKKMVFTTPAQNDGGLKWCAFNQWMPVCKIAIFRKSLVLGMKTSQRPSSISVLMEVRLVTAMTRGFFSLWPRSMTAHTRSFVTKTKKPSGTQSSKDLPRTSKDKQGQASLKGKLF